MTKSPKEEVSVHLEETFKGYTTHGLHVCDFATGGGKSYTIAKLACNYYTNHFDRVIILCVQRKLADGINDEIISQIEKRGTLITADKFLYVKKNIEVIREAIEKCCLPKLVDKMEIKSADLEQQKKVSKRIVKDLLSESKRARKYYNGLKNLLQISSPNDPKRLSEQLGEDESKLRLAIRNFFSAYGDYLEINNSRKASVKDILGDFPELEEVFPQVNILNKKVLLMTVQKSMWAIDPILTKKLTIDNFAENDKDTLIIFDESDQAAISMRETLFEMAIGRTIGNDRYNSGWTGYYWLKKFIGDVNVIDIDYHGIALRDKLQKANQRTEDIWGNKFGSVPQYNSIRLKDMGELETYRRGVFFSGPILKLNIRSKDDKTNSYIGYIDGDDHLTLVHCSKLEIDKLRFVHNLPMEDFLICSDKMLNTNLYTLVDITLKAYEQSKAKFKAELTKKDQIDEYYSGYPTRERETHTLVARFSDKSERSFEQLILEYISNRKNIKVNVNDKDYNFPDYSVYTQGFSLYEEDIDSGDNLHRVNISCRKLLTTPEKILMDLVMKGNTSIVLNSATASSKSVISNFDVTYLKNYLGEKFHELSSQDKKRFDELMKKTYPKEHKVEVIPLEKYEFKNQPILKWQLPDNYRNMFHKDAISSGLVEKWFAQTKNEFEEKYGESKDVSFQLYRLFQFIEAYSFFWRTKEIRSMLFFQNRTGLQDDDSKQIYLLSSLIDGSYKDKLSSESEKIQLKMESIDKDKDHVIITNKLEQVEDVLKRLENNKDDKIMLVAAYNSFKAGTNLQYKIAEGLKYCQGDDWEGENSGKKDWDAIYLQCPTSYLTMNDVSGEEKRENNLYNVILSLMMLKERGCLSTDEVKEWIYKAISGAPFYFYGDGVYNDKAAWVQNIIEQAIGRLCRTKNKPGTTYILYDESMSGYFEYVDSNMSMTKEYKEFVKQISSRLKETKNEKLKANEVMRCNLANNARNILRYYRSKALFYTPHPWDKDIDDVDIEENDKEISYRVKTSQLAYQAFKMAIIKKPVIYSLKELEQLGDICQKVPFLDKCYGEWERDAYSGYTFKYDPKKPYRISDDKDSVEKYVCPSSVRLDVLMKNKCIRDYFESNGYATKWKKEGLILHPEILLNDYCGEIGEEAFKALVLKYTDCTKEMIKHLEDKDYELADFVILNPDGTYKVAFDVKNWNPDNNYPDRKGGMPTREKRRLKLERLGCKLVTVNIINMKRETISATTEIPGLIDINGEIILEAINTIKELINKP